ncbi:isochorismate synthase [Phormidium tenue FACHB-886]|nr:isochorismate synthase [Phormidium tenue FACHB-886]
MLCQSPGVQLNSSQDCKQLYQFLDFCQRKSIADQEIKIANITLQLEAVDPLSVLQQCGQPNQLHFYAEKREQGWSVAAIDATLCCNISGSQRFIESQKFIQTSLNQLIVSSTISTPETAPRFFCSFTFFDENTDSRSQFSPATVVLPKLQIIRNHNRSFISINLKVDATSNLEALTKTAERQIKRVRSIRSDILSFPYPIPDLFKQWKIIDTYSFPSAVSAALRQIQQKQFNKVVLAHAIDVISRLPFQPERSLHHLRQRYPDCYVFSIGNGKGQSFIGASPERLLSLQGQRLITDALAGSAQRGRTAAEDKKLAQQLLDNDKEQREHRVVLDFIAETLTDFGLAPQYAAAPTLRQLSNIQHLHTPIQAAFPTDRHPLEILAALHPTPAVAGMPKAIACEQIHQSEQFGRSLYAAPLGWVDATGNAEFVVGIRSALLEGNQARLYAGAGIVAGSDPMKEMAEVRLKLQALLQTLV